MPSIVRLKTAKAMSFCFCRFTGMPSIVRLSPVECGKGILVEVMKKMSQKSRDKKRLKEEKKTEGKEIEEMLDDLSSLGCSIFAT